MGDSSDFLIRKTTEWKFAGLCFRYKLGSVSYLELSSVPHFLVISRYKYTKIFLEKIEFPYIIQNPYGNKTSVV